MSSKGTYHVTVERQDGAHARASSHGHALTLGVRRGDPTAGFNAAETLLAALIALFDLAVGFIAGLLGVGGGIFIVPL